MFSYTNAIYLRIVNCNYGGVDLSTVSRDHSNLQSIYLKEISDITPLTFAMKNIVLVHSECVISEIELWNSAKT